MSGQEKGAGHTPLPWSGGVGENIRSESGGLIATVYDGIRSSDTDDGIADANAALIVRAVNAHAELVGLLERSDATLAAILQWISNWDVAFQAEPEWLGDKRVAEQVRADIRTALAKAGA